MAFKEERWRGTIEETRVVSMACDNCGKDLTPVFNGPKDDSRPGGRWKGLQANDALAIHFVGYYGGYYDQFSPTPPIHFCKECADKLTEAFPSLRKAIDEQEDRDFGRDPNFVGGLEAAPEQAKDEKTGDDAGP